MIYIQRFLAAMLCNICYFLSDASGNGNVDHGYVGCMRSYAINFWRLRSTSEGHKQQWPESYHNFVECALTTMMTCSIHHPQGYKLSKGLQGKGEQCNSQVSHHRPRRGREPCHRLDKAKVVDREAQRQTRWIKEAFWSSKTPICMTRDAGSYQLSDT